AILRTAGYGLVLPQPATPAPSEPVAPVDGGQPPAEIAMMREPPAFTPTLDRFGRDLTRQAREGKLGQLVCRDAELDLVIETLCRRTKRNPALVGPAGV